MTWKARQDRFREIILSARPGLASLGLVTTYINDFLLTGELID